MPTSGQFVMIWNEPHGLCADTFYYDNLKEVRSHTLGYKVDDSVLACLKHKNVVFFIAD